MRREILFPLVGFLGGFVLAAIVFWQPGSPSGDESKSDASGGTSNRASVANPAPDRSRRCLVISARENEGVAPSTDSAPQPKGAAEIFQEAIERLNDLETSSRESIIKSLSMQLRAAGPEGAQVLRNFFRAAQDVTFSQNGSVVVDGKMVHSLRTALLDSLGDWPAGEANEIALEILRTTSRRADASIAIHLLEKNAPGAYRTEAIQAFQQLAGTPFAKGDWLTNDMLFDTMRRFKATELLPAAEATLGNDASETARFIASLDALPADVRAGALQRLFANEAVTKYLATNSWAIQSLNYSEPIVAQNVAQIFTANTDKKFREDLVQAIGQPWNDGAMSSLASDRVARWQARVAFLETVAPQCTTPVLQERLQDAREALQRAIANPDSNPLVRGGAGTLILSGTNTYSGSTMIRVSGRTGTLQITPAAEKK